MPGNPTMAVVDWAEPGGALRFELPEGRRDASKVALYYLVQRLRSRDFRLLDVQFLTPHLIRMGALELPRRLYLGQLRQALAVETSFG